MLKGAIHAEFYRSLRHWPLMFFGFAFVPLCSLVLSILLQLNTLQIPGANARIDLAARLLRELSVSGSPFAQTFFILAGALIFAAEYDSATWRLLAPRAARSDFIWAKTALYSSGVCMSLALLLLTAACAALFASVRLRAPLVWQLADGSPALAVLLQFCVSWLELTLLGLLAGAVGMLARSALIGAVCLILWAFAQALLATILNMRNASWLAFAGLPAFSVEIMRFFVAHREFAPDRYVTSAEALKAAASLALWLSGTMCFMLFKFRSQELSRE